MGRLKLGEAMLQQVNGNQRVSVTERFRATGQA